MGKLTMIFFGPDYDLLGEYPPDMAKSSAISLVTVSLKAENILLPRRLEGRYGLGFLHFVPGQRGKHTEGSSFNTWLGKLMDGLGTTGGQMPEEWRAEKIDAVTVENSGGIILQVFWNQPTPDLILLAAKQLDASFLSNGGEYPLPVPDFFQRFHVIPGPGFLTRWKAQRWAKEAAQAFAQQ